MGRAATVILNSIQHKPSPFFSEGHLDKLQTGRGFSSRQMKKITHFIRTSTDKKSIHSPYRHHRRKNQSVTTWITLKWRPPLPGNYPDQLFTRMQQANLSIK